MPRVTVIGGATILTMDPALPGPGALAIEAYTLGAARAGGLDSVCGSLGAGGPTFWSWTGPRRRGAPTTSLA